MFTGIVREVGSVVSFDGHRLVVDAKTYAAEGDSVSVDGSQLAFDVVDETLARTTLGELKAGDRVNLEPALRAGEPLGGHLVQGHVDGTGQVSGLSEDGVARRIRVAMPPDIGLYVVEHGSIAVDGVSLTVARVAGDGFE